MVAVSEMVSRWWWCIELYGVDFHRFPNQKVDMYIHTYIHTYIHIQHILIIIYIYIYIIHAHTTNNTTYEYCVMSTHDSVGWISTLGGRISTDFHRPSMGFQVVYL